MADRAAKAGGGMTVPAPEIKLSDEGHRLVVGERWHDLPVSISKETIGELAETLAFYGAEANHSSNEAKMPAIWADNGEKARSVLLSIGAIEDVAELEEEGL